MVTGADIVNSGYTWVTDKVPYVWGGISKAGADCSGYVQNVLAGLGVNVGRTVGEQARQGTAVPIGSSTNPLVNAQPGDVLIFGSNMHEGIYVGNGQMMDEPHKGTVASVRNVWFGGSEPLTDIRRFTTADTGSLSNATLTPVSLPGTGAVSNIAGDAGKALLNELTKPFTALGGSLTETLTRGTLIVFGAVMVLIALSALASDAPTPIGVTAHGASAVGANVRKVATTAATVVPK